MILDASALLALLQDEPGAEKVAAVIGQSKISTVNWSEVIQKLARHDSQAANIRPDVEALGLIIVPLSVEQAEGAAILWPLTRPLGLSLADRICLQLGIAMQEAVLTADALWQDVEHSELVVELIR
jgi:PIN domain nuclease of toxin-antitoxin system